MIHIINSLFEIIGGIFETIVDTIFDFSVSAVSSRRKQQYNADFLPASKILFSHEKGFCLTGNKSLGIEESYSNCLIIGGSGSGKSSRILIPSILRMAGHSSLVIHDPSGELFEKSSAAVAQLRCTIKVINYSNPGCSEGYNPLQRAKSISDIQKISKLVVHTALGQGKDPFWNVSAESLISLFARYLVEYASPEYRTLHNVLHLINTFGFKPEQIDKLIVSTRDSEIISDYKAFVSYDNKMLMSIVATARAALSIFSDPSVAQVTATDTIDFEKFRHERTILYINNSVSDMRYYSVISSIFFEQFFGAIMSRLPAKNELPIFFLLDESSSLYLNILPVAIANIRKSRAGILSVYQHYNQIIDLYGQAQARNIAANSYAKVYMTGQPSETAKEIESMLGKFEFVDDDGIQRMRSLMPADEIRQLKDSIILCGNNPPIRAKMIPYYEQKDLMKLSKIPPYQLENKLSGTIPSLIQFE